MEFPSKALEQAILSFKSLPGIGRKTATRLALHLLKKSEDEIGSFASAIEALSKEVMYCEKCHNISDERICKICQDKSRNQSLVCVVQDIRDVIAIESTAQYRGSYHVLGGVISPMDGIGPDELHIASLVERCKEGEPEELIFALSATMEGDTTIFYIAKQLKELKLRISTISRGISIGGELEYVDEITLGRSLSSRVPYKTSA